MYYVTLNKFWWKFAKKNGYLEDNGKHGTKFVKSKRLGKFWVTRETLREWFFHE